jgi:hypothetical protein
MNEKRVFEQGNDYNDSIERFTKWRLGKLAITGCCTLIESTTFSFFFRFEKKEHNFAKLIFRTFFLMKMQHI